MRVETENISQTSRESADANRQNFEDSPNTQDQEIMQEQDIVEEQILERMGPEN